MGRHQPKKKKKATTTNSSSRNNKKTKTQHQGDLSSQPGPQSTQQKTQIGLSTESSHTPTATPGQQRGKDQATALKPPPTTRTLTATANVGVQEESKASSSAILANSEPTEDLGKKLTFTTATSPKPTKPTQQNEVLNNSSTCSSTTKDPNEFHDPDLDEKLSTLDLETITQEDKNPAATTPSPPSVAPTPAAPQGTLSAISDRASVDATTPRVQQPYLEAAEKAMQDNNDDDATMEDSKDTASTSTEDTSNISTPTMQPQCRNVPRARTNRYDVKLHVAPNQNAPAALRTALMDFFKKIKEEDSQAVIYPWFATDSQARALRKPDDIPTDVGSL